MHYNVLKVANDSFFVKLKGQRSTICIIYSMHDLI